MEEILQKIGADDPLYRYTTYGDSSLSVDATTFNKIKTEAPYLISMVATDISTLQPLNKREPKHHETLNIPKPKNEPTIGVIDTLFDDSVYFVLEELFRSGVYPIVYAHIGDKEKFSFVPQLCTKGMKTFLESRKGDIRTNAVNSLSELGNNEIEMRDSYDAVFHLVTAAKGAQQCYTTANNAARTESVKN